MCCLLQTFCYILFTRLSRLYHLVDCAVALFKVVVSKIECDIIHTLRLLIGNEVFVGTTMRKKWLWGRHKVVGFKGW